MKKIFITVSIILIAVIVFLSVSLYLEKASLEQSREQISEMSFKEGDNIVNEKGGVVTASLKTWVYFQDDSFVTESKPTGTSIEGIFCDLHKAGLVDSFKGNLVKFKYSQEIIVKSGKDIEKSYFVVGDYYITCK